MKKRISNINCMWFFLNFYFLLFRCIYPFLSLFLIENIYTTYSDHIFPPLTPPRSFPFLHPSHSTPLLSLSLRTLKHRLQITRRTKRETLKHRQQLRSADQESRWREWAKKNLNDSLRKRQQQYRSDQEQFPKTQIESARIGPQDKDAAGMYIW